MDSFREKCGIINAWLMTIIVITVEWQVTEERKKKKERKKGFALSHWEKCITRKVVLERTVEE